MTPPPRRRSDVERNRQRLLDAARRVYREQGSDASLDAIATAAGVGNATLYRHFPDRSALLTAVLALCLQEVEDVLADLEREPDAWRAVERYVRHLASVPDNMLVDVLVTPPAATPEVTGQREEIRLRVRRLLERAQQAGALRPGYTVDDMNVFLFAHAKAASSPRIGATASVRLLEDYLAGVRR